VTVPRYLYHWVDVVGCCLVDFAGFCLLYVVWWTLLDVFWLRVGLVVDDDDAWGETEGSSN